MANRLIGEQSPYLLQHAHNPVDWYPWGDEAFGRARKEQKPVIVSIGYAACHWCHVMERESFENEEVARYMNEHFVCIKVDREEHPDVDHLYMDAVQALSGSGGWPLNVFVTPERIPFYGGTYFPPEPAYGRSSWMQLLQRIQEIWRDQAEEVANQSGQVLQYLRQASQTGFASRPGNPDKALVGETMERLMQQADRQHGGFGNAPKFPGSMALSFLIEHAQFTGNSLARDHALFSLDAMLQGGIYDQIGGGFARYATDGKWLVPHFEKMLYDNALLLLTLCDAFQLTGDNKYRVAIEETIAFAERELKDDSGLYYSALDADSEGVEGLYYTWRWEEWSAVVGDEAVTEYFGVLPGGNWEHTNILHTERSVAQLAAERGLEARDLAARIAGARASLMEARSGRKRPLTDDKSLLSWNALMNRALCRASVVLNRHDYLDRARQHMESMLRSFRTEAGLMHTWKQGVARIPAKLDDQAYLIRALMELGSATEEEGWLLLAASLCEALPRTFDHEEGVYFYFSSSGQDDLPVMKVDLYDGALPSANAVLAECLLMLGMCMERTHWIERSREMLCRMTETVRQYPSSFGYWAMLIQRYVQDPRTVVCAGKDASTAAARLRSLFLPHCLVLTSKKEISELPVLKGKPLSGQLLIFVCKQQACLAPVHTVEESLHLISAI